MNYKDSMNYYLRQRRIMMKLKNNIKIRLEIQNIKYKYRLKQMKKKRKLIKNQKNKFNNKIKVLLIKNKNLKCVNNN